MKRVLFLFALLSSALAVQAQSGTPALEVSFLYTRQKGFASNQFAVWIEDAQGRHIKTLYAGRFTASGGWKKRPIPLWVKQSAAEKMTAAQIDAVSGATPESGRLVYRWDGALPPGDYVVYVEATLRNEAPRPEGRGIWRASHCLTGASVERKFIIPGSNTPPEFNRPEGRGIRPQANENRVLYRSPVRTGNGPAEAVVEMLSGVTVRVLR